MYVVEVVSLTMKIHKLLYQNTRNVFVNFVDDFEWNAKKKTFINLLHF